MRQGLRGRARITEGLHGGCVHGGGGGADSRDESTLVLFPHTYQVRDFAPKLATRFSQVLISDVIAVKMDAGSTDVRAAAVPREAEWRRAGVGRRSLFRVVTGGRISGGCAWKPVRRRSRISRRRSMRRSIRQKPEAPFRESARAVDLTAAEIIVSVGPRHQGKGKHSRGRGTGEGTGRRAGGIAADLRRGLAADGDGRSEVRGRRWRRRCTWRSGSPARFSTWSG